MLEAETAGAKITDPAKDTFWGGYSGHSSYLTGHLWEVVWNPEWEIDGLIMIWENQHILNGLVFLYRLVTLHRPYCIC